MTSEPNDVARETALRRLKSKRAFKYSAYSYVVINIFLWVIWAFSKGNDDSFPPWPAWVTLAWGIGLAFQGWNAYGNNQISEADIQREIDKGS